MHKPATPSQPQCAKAWLPSATVTNTIKASCHEAGSHDHRAPAHPAQRADLPWLSLLSFYGTDVQLTHRHTGQQARLSIRPRLGTDNLHALRNAAVAGLGAGIASAWAVAEHLSRGELIQLAPDWAAAPLPIYLVYPRTSFRSARLKAFIDTMRAHFPLMPSVPTVAR